MNLLLEIAYVFFKIGLLTVGGGLAMIPIIQHEMLARGWLNNQQFLDILGVAEMTPGPISVNTATFVGYHVFSNTHAAGSFWLAMGSALVGTLAVCAPSVVFISLLGGVWQRNRNHPCMVKVFDILRPLVTGLIITAAVSLLLQALWGGTFTAILKHAPHWGATGIALAAFALTAFTRTSPVLVLLGGITLGVLFQI